MTIFPNNANIMYIFLHGLFSIREKAGVYLKNMSPQKRAEIRFCYHIKTLSVLKNAKKTLRQRHFYRLRLLLQNNGTQEKCMGLGRVLSRSRSHCIHQLSIDS